MQSDSGYIVQTTRASV